MLQSSKEHQRVKTEIQKRKQRVRTAAEWGGPLSCSIRVTPGTFESQTGCWSMGPRSWVTCATLQLKILQKLPVAIMTLPHPPLWHLPLPSFQSSSKAFFFCVSFCSPWSLFSPFLNADIRPFPGVSHSGLSLLIMLSPPRTPSTTSYLHNAEVSLLRGICSLLTWHLEVFSNNTWPTYKESSSHLIQYLPVLILSLAPITIWNHLICESACV